LNTLSGPVVIATALAYLLLLAAIAHVGDRRAAQGRSIIGNAWVYTLSLAVYCTAWTYFGSVGRAASSGLWFLPIYLGPTLGMLVAWMVLRKMIRIARTQRGWLKNVMSYDMFHHVEHHLFPAVPTCHLPELSNRLDRVAPEYKDLMVY